MTARQQFLDTLSPTPHATANETPWIPFEMLPAFTHYLVRISDRSHRRNETALILELGLCGLRSQEVINLQPTDITVRGDVRVATLKRGRPRLIAPPPRMRKRLCQLADDNHDRTQLFTPTQPDVLSQLSKRHTLHALGWPFSFHSLRKTCAMWLYHHSGHDLKLVQSVLGHRHLSSTLAYIQTEALETTHLPVASFPELAGNAEAPQFRKLNRRQLRIHLYDPLQATCPVCGRTFKRGRTTKIYCSRACADRRARQRKPKGDQP